MSRKKRVGWKKAILYYNKEHKQFSKGVSEEEFKRLCDEIAIHQAVIHHLMSRLIVDFEIIIDDIKHLGANNDDIEYAYDKVLKFGNIAVDLVETGIDTYNKKLFLEDHEVFNAAMDDFFEPHITEMPDNIAAEIKYNANFSKHKPFYTQEEAQQYYSGYSNGYEGGLSRKMDFNIVVCGKNYTINKEDLQKWLQDELNKRGEMPEELFYYTEERQGK